jgi:c-di-GMP-binding flagellar brake protein YcgR
VRVEKIERRHNRRVFFLKENDVNATLKMLGGVETYFQVRVKDISLEGMGFLLERTEPVIPSSGDRLIISRVQEAKAVDFLTQTTLEVQWVVDTALLDHIGFGCSFLNLDPATQTTLNNYIMAST